MAEPEDARRLPTNLDVLASDVHSKVEFYKNAYMDCIGINNVLHGVMEEKGKLQVEQKGKYSNSCVLVGSLQSNFLCCRLY
jgi:hypothetical protein